LDRYAVKIFARARRDLENIYAYIADNISEPDIARRIADELEKAIYSLEQLPERGPVRRTGVYANGEYRQLFVRNYAIVYRVQKEKREVYIVTIRYAPSSF